MNQDEISIVTDSRLSALQNWFISRLPELGISRQQELDVVAVSGDASFRRYFRVSIDNRSFILVDAPPEKENSLPFVRIAKLLSAQGVNVPQLHAINLEEGFMCLDDFGDELLWGRLHFAQADGNLSLATRYYNKAFEELLRIQSCSFQEADLPRFDRQRLLDEMLLFRHWLCENLLDIKLGPADITMQDEIFEYLAEAAIAQQQVFVHRDYHSRNLMFLGDDSPLGVIDFQDAVLGPLTYDLVSLLKDCYIHWPRGQVNAWAIQYARMAADQGIIAELDESQFLNDFDLMGVQRHLKAAGIFARLHIRDQKSSYLRDIPRTLNYILEAGGAHPVLQPFYDWLGSSIMPSLETTINSALEKNIRS